MSKIFPYWRIDYCFGEHQMFLFFDLLLKKNSDHFFCLIFNQLRFLYFQDTKHFISTDSSKLLSQRLQNLKYISMERSMISKYLIEFLEDLKFLRTLKLYLIYLEKDLVVTPFIKIFKRINFLEINIYEDNGNIESLLPHIKNKFSLLSLVSYPNHNLQDILLTTKIRTLSLTNYESPFSGQKVFSCQLDHMKHLKIYFLCESSYFLFFQIVKQSRNLNILFINNSSDHPKIFEWFFFLQKLKKFVFVYFGKFFNYEKTLSQIAKYCKSLKSLDFRSDSSQDIKYFEPVTLSCKYLQKFRLGIIKLDIKFFEKIIQRWIHLTFLKLENINNLSSKKVLKIIKKSKKIKTLILRTTENVHFKRLQEYCLLNNIK